MNRKTRILLSAVCGIIFLSAAVFACINIYGYGSALRDNLAAAYLMNKTSVYGSPEHICSRISELEQQIASLSEACDELDADTAQQQELASQLDELSEQASKAILIMQQEQQEYNDLLKKYEQLQERYRDLQEKYAQLTEGESQ